MSAKGERALCRAASCGGCEIAVPAVDGRIPDVAGAIDIVLRFCIMDGKVRDVEKMEVESIDLCLFNGSIRTSEQEYIANLLRAESKLLAAFGSRAQEGGIPGPGSLHGKHAIFWTNYPGSVERRPTCPRSPRNS